MRKNKRRLASALALIIAFTPFYSYLSALTPTLGGEQTIVKELSSNDEQTITTFSKGPGVTNLSLGDEYATYQWALKNDGEFQLIELKAKFDALDTLYRGTSGGSGSIGLPRQKGPGNYEAAITSAISGMDINILPAWELYDKAENKRQVIVAIVDTGIDYQHEDLKDAIWTNSGEIPEDGVDNDGNGYVDDVHGWNFYSNSNEVYVGEEDSHGTHAAGTIAAAKGANGIVGIADSQYVKILPVKALGGEDGLGSPEAVIQAIKYAEAQGASICNLSLGTSTYNEDLARAIKDSNMLFIVACGNGGLTGLGYNTDEYPVYPASLPYDNVISVANLLFDGSISSDSNYGAASVDIAAPGTYVLSTVPGNKYSFMSGTSMAAPMVTGVAALLYSYRTDISLNDVKTSLLNSARKMDGLNGKLLSGGMLDAYGALSY